MRVYFLYLLVLFIPLACSSPQKSFEKGNYEKAYKGTLKDYKKGKRSREAKKIMNTSFKELINECSNNAERYLKSDVIEDWESAFQQYDKLVNLYYEGKGYIDKMFDSPMKDIETDRETLGVDIANSYFGLGQTAMKDYGINLDKSFAQDGFAFYEKAKAYNSAIKDIDFLIEEALSAAIVSVLVEADSPFDYRYSREIDQVFADIERESEGFYQISYKRNLPTVDCLLEIDFSRLDINTRESSSSEEFSLEVEDGYETKVDTSGQSTRVPKYKTVYCTVTTVVENISYSWRAAVNVQNDRNYCDFRNRYFDAQEIVNNERYQISGDNRAAPSRYTQSTSRDNRRTEDVVEDLIEEIYSEVARYYFN